ncbi:hypothetical protein FRC09_009558 [Ceratobasidium sp. 395]|nr:hypothetical protein FRC09_009558 [Ceratobasidium sp. 395]
MPTEPTVEGGSALKGSALTNRLPSELLAQIFVLCEKRHRHARLTSNSYSGFQDVATQVCRYWREVAIQTPELWTYIFITRPQPYEHVKLYLSRSGACCIHVDLIIQLSKTEGNGDSQQLNWMFRMMESIFRSGGAWARWSSFVLTAGFPGVFYKAAEHLNDWPTPNLKFVSFQCRQSVGSSFSEFQNPATVVPPYTLDVCPDRPLLGSVELSGLPEHFIFSRPKPLVSSLRRLGLGCGRNPYTLPNLSLLFSVCAAQLESLSLDASLSSIRAAIRLEDPPIASLKVFLPSLRFLSVDFIFSFAWATNVLRIIDAPNVEVFLCDFQYIGDAGKAEFMRYVSSGRLNGTLQGKPTGGLPGAGPLFPSLHTLGLPNLSFNDTTLTALFDAYTGITKASLSANVVEFLGHPNRPLPNLKHLRCPNENKTVTPVKELIQKRSNWGIKLSLLELVTGDYRSVGWDTMGAIEHDLERAILGGLVVRKIERWPFGWLGVYDIEDCVPT